MKNPKPEPIVVTTICSLCGELWDAHGEAPSTLDCIRLLRAKADAHQTVIYRWYPQNYPVYPQPYRVYPYPGPNWSGNSYTMQGTSGSINAALAQTTANVIEFKRPDDPPDATPVAV